jgi:hypothetical protein
LIIGSVGMLVARRGDGDDNPRPAREAEEEER